jgi:hypothetical protein
MKMFCYPYYCLFIICISFYVFNISEGATEINTGDMELISKRFVN